MLRTNLSTRPFYNERAVHVLLGLAALVVVLLTAFNAIRIVSLSRLNTELSRLIDNDREEARRLLQQAQKIRAGINQDELKATSEAAALANALIDQRTFSWTEFFNRIEETLPADVMLTSVTPAFEQNSTVVNMAVLGRRTEDIDEFIGRLEGTGAFGDVLPATEDLTDEGLHRVILRTVYTGVAAGTPPAGPADAPPAKPAQPAGKQPAAATPGRGGAGR